MTSPSRSRWAVDSNLREALRSLRAASCRSPLRHSGSGSLDLVLTAEIARDDLRKWIVRAA